MAKICKVLVVEDDPDVKALLEAVLGYEGYHFSAVANGAEMRRALARGDIDVAVIDVLLPGGDNGYALAKEAADCGCGVILVTGHGLHFEAVERSGYRYLLKPYRASSLLELVEEVLEETRARCQVKDRVLGATA